LYHAVLLSGLQIFLTITSVGPLGWRMYGHWFIIYKKDRLYLAKHMKYMSETAQMYKLTTIYSVQKRPALRHSKKCEIHSAVLANSKDRVNTNWHYYKFNFKMWINKAHPILEPLLEPIYDHDSS